MKIKNKVDIAGMVQPLSEIVAGFVYMIRNWRTIRERKILYSCLRSAKKAIQAMEEHEDSITEIDKQKALEEVFHYLRQLEKREDKLTQK